MTIGSRTGRKGKGKEGKGREGKGRKKNSADQS
jgi:hypothetical protein